MTMTTWREVTEACDRWIESDAQHGNLTWDNFDEWAHETADGCEYAIYYRHHDALWCEGAVTPVHEVEAELSAQGILSGDIQDRIQQCVFSAIRDYLFYASEKYLRDHSRYETYVGEKEVWFSVEGAYFSIPVMKGRWVLDHDSMLHGWERELLGMPPWVPCA